MQWTVFQGNKYEILSALDFQKNLREAVYGVPICVIYGSAEILDKDSVMTVSDISINTMTLVIIKNRLSNVLSFIFVGVSGKG